MLGLQISISLIALIGGIAFAENATFQQTYDFGYDVHNTIGITVKDKNHFDAIKNEVAKLPQVTAMAGTKDNIGFSRRREVTEVEGMKKEAMFLEVGAHYLNVMNVKMAAGRGFSDSLQGDYTRSILVSEKYAALFGWKPDQALGRQIRIDTLRYSIVGVVRDFHPVTLFEPAEPIVIKLTDEKNYSDLIIQAKNADLAGIYGLAESTWKKTFPSEPFHGFYQDEIILNAYNTSASIAQIFSGLAVVTALLSAAGTFALISLTLLKRMREIALRKVVGAKPSDIYLLMNKGYFWILLAAVFIGCYAGLSLTRSLLDQIFIINVGVKTSTILLSALLMIAIAAVTTGVKIMQAIRTKPVDLLRME
jgi:ABC-type antimicrobial peptide transport system permease subunit